MKKIFNLLLCGGLAFILTACNNKNSLLNNPKAVDIKNAIEKLEGVKSTCLVTENNDPNGKLNKQGGYTGAVYFRLKQVDEKNEKNEKEEFPIEISEDACEAGTDGGGQIEIYANKKDAEGRNEYLSTIDSVISGGYHIVHGTLVIRISDKLTASEQKEFEEKMYNLLSEK